MSEQASPPSPPRPQTHPLTLTNVEEQGGPDRKSQSPQVVLGLGTPLEAHRQQVANHHSAHLREDMTTNRWVHSDTGGQCFFHVQYYFRILKHCSRIY